ncbi:MAG TPA: hypothetical protein DD727_06325 [Clostridiales bacterium]|nr:hypothetical protein [Clostridiales bacterium]
MCATYRIFVDEDQEDIRKIIEEAQQNVDDSTAEILLRKAAGQDIYPGDPAPVILKDRSVTAAHWGFPMSTFKGGKISRTGVFNARGESIGIKSMFKYRLQDGRCLIPATEFYEWDARGKSKKRVSIRLQTGGILHFAGLYGIFIQEPGILVSCFTLVTIAANAQLAPIHDRMPAILDPAEADEWLLSPMASALKLLRPYPGLLQIK